MNNNIRPAAVPLITVDPFFSIWSCSDNLNDICTKHWNEKPNPIVAGIFIKGVFYSMAGVTADFVGLSRKMYQKSLNVTPLTSEYVFEAGDVRVKLKFTTPLLIENISILTRPVSYIEYEIEEGFSNDVEFVFGINSRCCVDERGQQVKFEKTGFSLKCGNVVQNPLDKSGDKVSIDWGYLHLCDKDAFCGIWENDFTLKEASINKIYDAFCQMPYLMVKKQEKSGIITVAYDEIYPIEYFGEKLKECYTNEFDSFEKMVLASVKDSYNIIKMCNEFDEKIIGDCEKFGENYVNIISLAYRQAIAAHKLVYDNNGEVLFLSKECESNGCIGTLDVTYPSIPLFLKYNPELVVGMLRPIFKYAASEEWKYDFAPHDVGQYPIANGQVYGMERDEEKQLSMQMPVEESANMMLCIAAVAKVAKEKADKIFNDNKEVLKKWADYLVEFGYDPGEQLCTDDFAGHLKSNCNLSVKAILGIAAYSMLSGEESYMDVAKRYAAKWEKDAVANHGATRLTFDEADGWSMKYNMIWDNIFDFGLFSQETKKSEIKLYKEKLNRYGVPLDSRKDYTKVDWLMWTTRLDDSDKDYFDKVTQSIVNMINETQERVPLTDWYESSTADHIFFQARSVVGGLFINLL